MLIVEDEVKMAGLIRRGLLEEGHAADIAANGEDAIWMAGATKYDAIVLDVMLPAARSANASGLARRGGNPALPEGVCAARDADAPARPNRVSRRRRWVGIPACLSSSRVRSLHPRERCTRAGGAGLGLSIVEVIARAHGGSAHAINRPGGGADVWLSLPVPVVSR